MKYVLYNPLASNKNGEKKAKTIIAGCPNPYYEFVDITSISKEAFDEIILSEYDVILAGGDGTLNSFINMLDGKVPEKTLYFYPTGSGNDFMRDVGEDFEDGQLIELNKYIKDLPIIESNGRRRRFINGAGYGIDAYSCAMVEEKAKENDGKKGSYVLQAFLGFMGKYTPCKAKVTVDGVTSEHEDVWMISAMNGRYFGGGVMIAPHQDRLNEDGEVSLVVVSSKSRLRALTAFPSIFKGKHLKYTELVKIYKGKEILVEAESEASVQIDGDTMHGVTSYTVVSGKIKAEKRSEEKELETV